MFREMSFFMHQERPLCSRRPVRDLGQYLLDADADAHQKFHSAEQPGCVHGRQQRGVEPPTGQGAAGIRVPRVRLDLLDVWDRSGVSFAYNALIGAKAFFVTMILTI